MPPKRSIRVRVLVGAPTNTFLVYFKAPQPFGCGAFYCLIYSSNRLVTVFIDTTKHSISNKVTRRSYSIFNIDFATASATLIPSIPADNMPPA